MARTSQDQDHELFLKIMRSIKSLRVYLVSDGERSTELRLSAGPDEHLRTRAAHDEVTGNGRALDPYRYNRGGVHSAFFVVIDLWVRYRPRRSGQEAYAVIRTNKGDIMVIFTKDGVRVMDGRMVRLPTS